MADTDTTALCKHCGLRIRHDPERRWVHAETGQMTCDELGWHHGQLYADPEGTRCCTACAGSGGDQ